MTDICEHLVNVPEDPIPPGGCVECLAIGSTWVHLRHCVTCGQTRCCDSSPNRHASRHARESGHPVVRSAEPEDDWAWCYLDDVAVMVPRRER